MNREEILAALLQCLDDDAVSRSERAVMDDIIDEHLPGRDARMAVQAQLFDAVRERLRHPDDKRLLDGLEGAGLIDVSRRRDRKRLDRPDPGSGGDLANP